MVHVELRQQQKGITAGYPSSVGYAGWKESKLCQSMPFDKWWSFQEAFMEEEDHDKIVLGVHDCGWLYEVGGVFLVEGLDAQVGRALMCWHQYVLPDYRNKVSWRKVLRLAEVAAQERGLKWLIWTHQDESSGRIFYTYKEV